MQLLRNVGRLSGGARRSGVTNAGQHADNADGRLAIFGGRRRHSFDAEGACREFRSLGPRRRSTDAPAAALDGGRSIDGNAERFARRRYRRFRARLSSVETTI